MADRLKPTSSLSNGSRLSNWSPHRLFETRFRRIMVWTVTAILFAVAGAYHALTALVRFPADATTDVIYTLDVALCYGLLFLTLSHQYRDQSLSVLNIFWRSTIFGILLFSALEFIPPLAQAGTYRTQSGIPEDLRTVLRTVLLTPVVVVFAMSLLFRFRGLVHFKRTKRSMRQWYAMLTAMVLASLAVYGSPDPALGINTVAGLLLGISFLLMVINSFRLSRIVYMSIQEKG